jgi:hypothetical protein
LYAFFFYDICVLFFDPRKLPNAQLLSAEITESPGDIGGEELPQSLMDQFRQAVLSFLGFETMADNDTVSKKINRQPSPLKECISFPFSFLHN